MLVMAMDLRVAGSFMALKLRVGVNDLTLLEPVFLLLFRQRELFRVGGSYAIEILSRAAVIRAVD